MNHIPYRNSTLTKLLKNSLGGNSITYVICTISPSSRDINETYMTLKFAEKAKLIKNTPVINSIMDLSKMKFELE